MADVDNSESAVIDGIEFVTTKFLPRRAVRLLTRLAKSLGGAFLAVAQLAPDTELSIASGPVMAALGTVDDKEIDGLLAEILAGTTAITTDAKGAKQTPLTAQTIDIVFKDKPLGTLFKAIAHALKVNYANFSSGSDAATSAPAAA